MKDILQYGMKYTILFMCIIYVRKFVFSRTRKTIFQHPGLGRNLDITKKCLMQSIPEQCVSEKFASHECLAKSMRCVSEARTGITITVSTSTPHATSLDDAPRFPICTASPWRRATSSGIAPGSSCSGNARCSLAKWKRCHQ